MEVSKPHSMAVTRDHALEYLNTVYKMANGTVLDAEHTLMRMDLDEMCAAVLSLFEQLQTAEREVAEWKADGSHWADRYVEAKRERDALGNALAQERAKPGGSFDQAADLQRLQEQLEAAHEALRGILQHTGAPNVWNNGDGCQLRDDGHTNCRPVIFDLARTALGEAPIPAKEPS